jgi:hypothetical protein
MPSQDNAPIPYQFNPGLSLRQPSQEDGTWIAVFAALNLPLLKELAAPCDLTDVLLARAGMAPAAEAIWHATVMRRAGLAP